MRSDRRTARSAPPRRGPLSAGGPTLRLAAVILIPTIAAIAAFLSWDAVVDRGNPMLVIDLPDAVDPGGAVDTADAPSVGKPSQGAADPALLADGPYGPLPRIAEDGRASLQEYAHPFDGRDDRSRVVVIVGDLGLDEDQTAATIRRLPSAVTLAFSAYAGNLPMWAQRARSDGHEILVALPLEADAFPYRDPGPRALLTTLEARENRDRLAWSLGRLTGYVGALNMTGDRYGRDARAMDLLASTLAQRGLLFVQGIVGDDGIVAEAAARHSLPVAYADLWIDGTPSREAIDAALAQLEEIAHDRAIAVGVARPYPVTVDRLAAWVETLADGSLVLAPVSAVAGRQVRP